MSVSPVCLFVRHQWLKHVDEQGRPYYYSADGSRSEWELPKVRLCRNPPSKLIKVNAVLGSSAYVQLTMTAMANSKMI